MIDVLMQKNAKGPRPKPVLLSSGPLRMRLLGMLLLILLTSTTTWAQNNAELNQLIQSSKTRAALVQSIQQAVVHIKVEKRVVNVNEPFPSPSHQEGMGSGSIVRPDGYILTNHHVAGDADKIIVQLFDGKELPARLVGTDPETDISVIKVEGEEMPVLPMGDSDSILVGESVIAVGNPFGLSHTVTFGIVSAKGRTGMGITEYEDFIQTDAAINPGNSGGPLVGLDGKIVGVNTAIFSQSGGYQGIGFAVPINMARRVMNDLIEKGRVSRGWLGVGIQDLTPELVHAFQLEKPQGSLITGVMPNTPAQRAGLQKGDVVLSMNGDPIQNSNDLRNEIANAHANANVELRIIRDGNPLSLRVRLDERPRQSGRDGQKKDPLPSANWGFSVQELTPDIAQRLGYEEGTTGIVITEVAPDSEAFRAGLRPGMLLVEVDRNSTASLQDFQRVARNSSLKKGVLLFVSSPQGSQYLFLQAD